MKPAKKLANLTEASIDIGSEGLVQFTEKLGKAAIAAAAAVLPPVKIRPSGRSPDVWARMVDCTSDFAVVSFCLSYYEYDRVTRLDHGEMTELNFKVPYTSKAGEITTGTPIPVTLKTVPQWIPIVEEPAGEGDDEEDDEEDEVEDEGEQEPGEDEGEGELDEAVDAPKSGARKKLPAVAYAAPFMANEAGEYDPKGKFLPSKSALPHHVNTATSATDNDSVDVPRLRNALARFDQTDWSRFGSAKDTVKEAARKHLDAHASAVLKSKETNESGLGDLLAKMRGSAIEECCKALGSKEVPKSAIEIARSVFDDVSGRHPKSYELGMALMRASSTK